jgi:formate-dependent nitrite reductase membrane component NrfD
VGLADHGRVLLRRRRRGLFLLSYLAGFPEGALAGLLVVGVLKTAAHMLFLGKPLRFWRAAFGRRTSWISRGVLAMTVFLVAGLAYLLPWFGVETGGAAKKAFGVVAAIAAVVVMTYDGFVLRASRGIAAWRSWLVPLLVFGYSLLGGATATLVLRAATGEGFSRWGLDAIELGALGVNLGLIALYAVVIRDRGGAARFAFEQLTRGRFRLVFAAAVAVGLGVTIALASVATATGSTALLAVAAVTDLAGHFAVFLALLRAGVYAPPRPLAR